MRAERLAMMLRLLLLLGCTACARPQSARLLIDGTETAFHSAQVLSIDDANQRYEITLAGKRRAASDDPSEIALVLGQLRLVTQSWGWGGDEGSFTFQATPAQARSFAAALKTVAREREPWRGELTGKLEAVGELSAGADHQPLLFTLTNTGPVTVWFMDGGRGRNEFGRDNRFTFVIERDGAQLATRELTDFGGIGVYRRLAPGESDVFELDLAHWIRLESAGKYSVLASYEAELMPADFEPRKALPVGWHAHLVRTRSVQAGLALDAR